jgi:hypothetical protein
MEDSRTTTYSQPTQTGTTLQAAVGCFDAAADSITFSKGFGVFFSAAAGQAALPGRVVQAITVAAFFDGAFSDKLTGAARRQGHNGFCLAGF